MAPVFRLEVNDKEGMAGFKEEMMNPKVLVWDLKKGKDQPSTLEESGDECGFAWLPQPQRLQKWDKKSPYKRFTSQTAFTNKNTTRNLR